MVYDKCVKDANGYGFPDVRVSPAEAQSDSESGVKLPCQWPVTGMEAGPEPADIVGPCARPLAEHDQLDSDWSPPGPQQSTQT